MPYPDSATDDEPARKGWVNHRLEAVLLGIALRLQRILEVVLENNRLQHLNAARLQRVEAIHNLPPLRPPAATSEPTMTDVPPVYDRRPYRPFPWGAAIVALVIILILLTNNPIRRGLERGLDYLFGRDPVMSTVTPTSVPGYTPSAYEAGKAEQYRLDHPAAPPPAAVPAADEVVTKSWLKPKLDEMNDKIDGLPGQTGPVVRKALTDDHADQDNLMIDCGGAWKDIAAARTQEERDSQIHKLSAQQNFPLCTRHWRAMGAWNDGPVNLPFAPMPAPTIIDQRRVYVVPARRHRLLRGGLPEYSVIEKY